MLLPPSLRPALPLQPIILQTFTKLAGSGASESGIGKLEMLTYNRDGWEFHAKGLWFFGGAADGKGAVTAVGKRDGAQRVLNREAVLAVAFPVSVRLQ